MQQDVSSRPPRPRRSAALYHVTPARNVARILREGLRPKIGRRARKLKETLPAVYCFPDPDTAADAVTNWLGDEFSASTRLALLRVIPLPGTLRISPAVDYEVLLAAPVPPENISVASPGF